MADRHGDHVAELGKIIADFDCGVGGRGEGIGICNLAVRARHIVHRSQQHVVGRDKQCGGIITLVQYQVKALDGAIAHTVAGGRVAGVSHACGQGVCLRISHIDRTQFPHGGEHQVISGLLSWDGCDNVIVIFILPALELIVLPDGFHGGQGIFLPLRDCHSGVGIVRIGGIEIEGQVDSGNVDRVALDVEGAKVLDLFGCVRAGTRNAGTQREVAGASQRHVDAFQQDGTIARRVDGDFRLPGRNICNSSSCRQIIGQCTGSPQESTATIIDTSHIDMTERYTVLIIKLNAQAATGNANIAFAHIEAQRHPDILRGFLRSNGLQFVTVSYRCRDMEIAIGLCAAARKGALQRGIRCQGAHGQAAQHHDEYQHQGDQTAPHCMRFGHVTFLLSNGYFFGTLPNVAPPCRQAAPA